MAERPTKKQRTSAEESGSDSEAASPDTPLAPEAPSQMSSTPSSSHKYGPDDLVLLEVGPDKQKIHAYSHRLSKNSEFFEAALKKDWVEGQTRVIPLPEVEPQTVLHYLDFDVDRVLPSSDIVKAKDLREHREAYTELFRLYAFGEFTLNTPIRNAVLKETIRLCETYDLGPANKDIEIVYEHTPTGSPLRRLLVDLHVRFGRLSWLDDTTGICEHVVEIAQEFTRKACSQLSADAFCGRNKPLKAEDYLM